MSSVATADYLVMGLILLSNLILGLIVLTKNRKSLQNIFFSAFAFCVIFWNLSAFISELTANASDKLILSKLSYGFALAALYFAVMFMYRFLSFKAGKFLGFVNLAIFLLTAIITTFTSLIISSISLTAYGFDINGGSYFLLYSLITIFFIAQFVINPILAFRKSHGTKRNQIKYLFFGFFLFVFTSLLFNVVLKFLTGSDYYYRYGNYSAIFLVAFSAYAIVKHRLMDIRMVVARSVSYSLLLVILAGFYAGSVLGIQALFFPQASADYNFAEGAVRTIIAVIMVFLFQPLKKWITKVTDSVFFKESYNVEELLDKVAHTVSSTIVMIEMLYKTLDLLTSQIKITRGLMLIFDDANKILETQSIGYKEGVKVDAKDAVALVKDGIIAADELSEDSKFKKLLTKYNVSVAVPLKTDNGVEGLLMLGEKQSGDMYSQSDLKVFEIIAPEIAVAVTNAKSYERIERFNVTLRQEIKKATSELEKKNEQLRALDKAKDEFISMASHQLRTPLTAIKGYLSMLLEGDAGEIKVSQYDFVNEAFQGANRMVGLINDLLNVSRMETGRFFLEPKEVDMEKVVSEEVKQLNKQAKEKGLKLEIKIKGKIPKVWVDETKVRQVVMNFADNAVYYTTSGTVTVTLEANKKNVIYKVKDTGIGVPKGQQKQLFEKFFRADNARHVRPDGTGLGIYLAKKVVDDHGGKLIFDSVEGKGSTFGFEIPIKSALKIKRITAPGPRTPTNTPQIGELAAGIGVDPKTLEATQIAGVEPPLPDSPDKEELEKEVAKVK